MKALKQMEYYKQLKIGGESNLYSCDCKSPSDLQIWLHVQRKKQKVPRILNNLAIWQCLLPEANTLFVMSGHSELTDVERCL